MTMTFYSMVLVLATLCFTCNGIKYSVCQSSNTEKRVLHVFTCDSRSGWKEFMALKTWNVTGETLRKNGLIMMNVCAGLNWGALGFLTKPVTYLKNIKKALSESPDPRQLHVILMDSDTFWSTNSIDTIWNRYDCARNGKEMVLSTEMSCWVGRYCTADDLNKWYNNPKATPSYSPFANSGFIMGRMSAVAKMLDYVAKHNASYFTTYKKLKFDDQYAIADYGIRVAPSEVELDYHQQLAASFSVHTSPDPPDEGWPFACKNRTGAISLSCPIHTNLARKYGHFVLDKASCLVGRSVSDSMTLMKEELESLSGSPLAWHGNGAGKQLYGHFGYVSYMCFLAKRNLTDSEYNSVYGYG